MNEERVNKGSFRDPCGFIFFKSGVLYRQVNKCYRKNYDLLINSGLYQELVRLNMLISHEEVNNCELSGNDSYKIVKPVQIPFISYPYEWCFSQFKDAALLTLEIQKKAIQFGMSLKDASAYNIQFFNGKPIFIDTLSFEHLKKGSPWVAYKQFCQHFLAPLLLMSYTDVRLNNLLKCNIDGIPLDLAAKLLPFKSKFKFGVLSHIILHSKSQLKYADKIVEKDKYSGNMSETSLLGLIDNLESIIRKLKFKLKKTEWDDYYLCNNNYNSEDLKYKMNFVSKCVELKKPIIVWDLGANDGKFSKLSARMDCFTVSLDIDPVCVERNYLSNVKTGKINMLPLIFDLVNPSPGIGWANNERASLADRGPVDMVFALALIHHLSISNNVPFNMLAEYFSKIAKNLIIEFIPREDSQVKKLLSSREDIFQNYTLEHFKKEFSEFFNIELVETFKESVRTIFLMVNKKWG